MITLGYNFFSDSESLSPTPINKITFNFIQLQNGIFDYLGISRDISQSYNTDKFVWDANTILNADFNGNLNAGNASFVVDEISVIRIKRKKRTDFNWITLKEIKISSVDDLNFIYLDNYASARETYDYALVPVYGQEEGDYLTNSIYSDFNGLFIVDKENNIQLYKEWENNSKQQVQQIGQFMPFGEQYPTIIKNGKLNYKQGSVRAFPTISNLPHVDIDLERKHLEVINSFFSNGNAKIMKDSNGNTYLIMIVDNINQSDIKSMGNALSYIEFSWIEIGNANSQKDLYNNNLVDYLE